MKRLFSPKNRLRGLMEGHSLFVSEAGEYYLCYGDDVTPETSLEGRFRIVRKNWAGADECILIGFSEGRLTFCILTVDEKTNRQRQIQTSMETMTAIQTHCPQPIRFMSHIESGLRRVRALESMGATFAPKGSGTHAWSNLRFVREALAEQNLYLNTDYSMVVSGGAVAVTCPENLAEVIRAVFDEAAIRLDHLFLLPARPEPECDPEMEAPTIEDMRAMVASKEAIFSAPDLLGHAELFGSSPNNDGLSDMLQGGVTPPAADVVDIDAEDDRALPPLEFSVELSFDQK